jgi:two-component system alkaline phosphatase synthesis response regulator PhoP/two-component system response regulator VicR
MNKSKILVIDDDVDLLASTKLFLESKNYEVDTAINTKTGLQILNSFQPDLIILDIIMDSNLEGYNFLNDLKSDDSLMKIPVVMNTSMAEALGVNMRSAIEDVDNLPNTRFIEKSGDWEELLKAVKELLQ